MKPDAFTIQETFLDVGDGHKLYVQEWGNSDSKKKCIFLHGGPGSGCFDNHKELFDPKTDRVLFFDQRGSGQSTPLGSIDNNTTQLLIDDIKLLAKRYGYDAFYLVGSSWGCTLALSYALAHPENVRGLILGGIFTGTKDEIEFLDKGMFRHFFPEVWESFVASVPDTNRNDPARYHANKVVNGTSHEIKKSAYAFSQLEGSVLKLDDRKNPIPFADFDPSSSRVEMYYMDNLCFLSEGYILQNANKLEMPIWLVQGRYDMLCPPITAHKLHNALPNSKLIMTIAGHSGSDRANFDARKSIIAAL